MNATLLKIVMCFAIFSLIPCAQAAKRADNEFDQICQIYKQVLTDPALKSQTHGEKMTEVFQRVHKTVTSKPGLKAFNAFMTGNPNTRYSALKRTAEHKLKHSWDCPILKTIK